MLEAEWALNVIGEKDINEVKVFTNPPEVAKMTLEAVLICLKASKTDWTSAKKVMEDNFITKLREFEVDKIGDGILKKVRVILSK